MAARKNVRSTARQLEMLVDYMSTHTLYANRFTIAGPLGREGQVEDWVRLQQMLQDGPNKTVEQWRTTWRDLKKKARADGAHVNSALAETGNHTTIPSLSDISTKFLNIIGTESAYGMAGQQETGLGEIVPPPPAAISSPPLSPFTSPPDIPSTATNSGPSVPTIVPPSTSSTATQQAGQRAQSLRNDFLVYDAETRSVLQDIGNKLDHKNKLKERKMRRSHLQRLRTSRMAKHNNIGPRKL